MEKQIFKVGDKVFDINHGWGEVINDNWVDEYPIRVEYKKGISNIYTHDGKWYRKSKNHILSFTEYTLQGLTQERPKPQPKVGDMCVFWDNNNTHDRRVIAILESINNGLYYENGAPWDSCITLDEFYEQQKK